MLHLATVPTLLYYLGIVLAIEIDARRYRTACRADRHAARRCGSCCATDTTSARSSRSSSSSVLGMTAFRAVVLATALSVRTRASSERSTSVHPPPTSGSARRRCHRRAVGRRDDGHRRVHRLGRDADRPRLRSSPASSSPSAGGILLLHRALLGPRRPGCSGLAVPVTASLHHRRGDHRARPAAARRVRRGARTCSSSTTPCSPRSRLPTALSARSRSGHHRRQARRRR